MSKIRTLVGFGALLLSACSAAQAANDACELMLSARITPKSRWAYVVQVSAENVSGRALTLVLPDRCPDGPIALEGLPAGYDYYESCNAGACLNGGAHSIQLAPREKRPLTTLALSAGGGACNPPLDPGLYQLRPLAPRLDMRVCVEPSRLDLRKWKPKPAPVQLVPVRAPPAPLELQPAGDARACTYTDECTISCPSVPGCCGWPCGCSNAIRRDRVATFPREYARVCTRAPNCPIVACAHEPAASAECIEGRCQAVRGFGH